jgi:hypothetical protein
MKKQEALNKMQELQEKVEELQKIINQPDVDVWVPEKWDLVCVWDNEETKDEWRIRPFKSYRSSDQLAFEMSNGVAWRHCAPIDNYIYQKPIPNWEPKVGEIVISRFGTAAKVVSIESSFKIRIAFADGGTAYHSKSELVQLTHEIFKV